MSFGVGASCGVALDLLLEQRLHAWPVVVDDRVPGRVANRIGQHHVLAEDPLERGSDAEECAADAQIPGVRLNSTRIAPQLSKAFRRSKYFVSMFAPVPHCARSSHVQPISVRRWNGSTFRYLVEPTGCPPTWTTKGTSVSLASASSNQRSKPSRYMPV